MLKESFFVNIFLKICSFFVSIIKESFVWNLLCRLNAKFNNSVENSSIVIVASLESDTDNAYSNRYGKWFSLISSVLKRCFSKISSSAKNSKLVEFAADMCNDFWVIPLRKPGVLLLVWGIVAFAGNFIKGAKITASVICVLIALIGILMCVFNKSLYDLLKGSFVFGKYIPENKSIGNRKWTLGLFLILGVILGVLSSVLGILPVIAVLVLCAVVIIGFYFTWQVAVLYVCILPFMPTMVMVAGGLALFACIAVKSLLGYNGKLFNEGYILNMYLLFMGIAFGLAAAFSYVRGSSIKIALVYIAFLLATYAMIRIFSTEKILSVVLNGISVFSIPVSLYGIYQHFNGFDEQNTWIDTEMFDDISGRVVSFFGNPNVFGEYLILVILTSVICFFICKSIKMKAIHLLAGVSSLGALVFTYSRGCWIGLVFALAIFLFFSKRKIFLAFCVLGAVSVFFLPDSIITRIASVGNLADSSTSYRVYIWEGTLNMLKDFWVTGIGLGSDAFNAVYPFYAYSAITAPHPHNLYLVILTETGIVGAIAFVLIVISYYNKLFCILRHSSDSNAKLISSGLVAGMSGFLLQGMFDNVWYNYRVFLLFWIFVALGAVTDIVFRRAKK